MATMDPEQILPKMIHLRAQSGGHRGRSIRLDGGRIPLATCAASTSQIKQKKRSRLELPCFGIWQKDSAWQILKQSMQPT